MTARTAGMCGLLALLAGCGEDADSSGRGADRREGSSAQRDAEALGHVVFEMVDRAVDYRGSHRGRPAATLRQMGIDSLTATMVRRVVNVNRQPVITVAFRRPEEHEIVSCRGDSHVLEEAALNGGRFTVMCTTQSGMQRPIEVGGASAR